MASRAMVVACNETFTQRAQRAIAKNAKEIEQAKHAKLHYWKLPVL